MPTVLSRRPGGGGGTGAGPAGPTGATGPTGPTGAGSGLPLGWTQDGNDPAELAANGGTLVLGESGADQNFQIERDRLQVSDDDGNAVVTIRNTVGVQSSPSASVSCFIASGQFGATQSLDGNTLPVVDIADPTNAQDAATKNYVDTAHVAAFVDPSTGSAEDIANALIAAGLMAPS